MKNPSSVLTIVILLIMSKPILANDHSEDIYFHIANIKSIDAKIQCIQRLYDITAIDLENNESANEAFHHTKSDLIYICKSSKYYMDIHVQIDGEHPEQQSEIRLSVAHNGEYHQTLQESGSLHITQKRGDDLVPLIMSRKNAFFMPYWFSYDQETFSNYQFADHPWSLDRRTLLNQFFIDAQPTPKPVIVDGSACAEYRATRILNTAPDFGQHSERLEEVEIRVLCSIDKGYYPIRWQIWSVERGLLIEYAVQELGNASQNPIDGQMPYYPRIALVTDYGFYSDQKADGTVHSTTEFTVAEVTFNSLDDYDSRFTIDLSTARVIYDVDHDVGYRVPK